MITNETVFILGAGASKPYGLPSGDELRRMLSSINDEESNLVKALRTYAGINSAEIIEFSRAFLRSKSPSIDAFLTTREKYVAVGKLAIAYVLAGRETPDLIHRTKAPEDWDDWYALLWSVLREGASKPSDISRNLVKFITFNYDRSLEYFLHHAVKETFGISDEQAESAWQELGILHIYGQIGRYSHKEGSDTRWYSPQLSARDLKIAAEGIQIIPDARDDSETFVTARGWLRWAKRICFLGFGFDSLNIQRLSFRHAAISKPERHKHIVASVYQKLPGEVSKLQIDLFGKEIQGNPGQSLFNTGEITVTWEHHDKVNSSTLRSSKLFI